MRWATSRATMSVVPPAGNGTMMRSGFDGNVCAPAAVATRQSSASTRRFMASLLGNGDCHHLVGFDVGLLDELGVFADFLRHHVLELLHRHRQRIAAELLDLLADLRRFDERGNVVV